MDSYNVVNKWIDQNSTPLLDLSDKIWSFSEMKFEEYKSADATKKIMKENGFEIHENVAGLETAFICSYGSGSPVIGFLGEYDALDGLSQQADVFHRSNEGSDLSGHGCGHNLLGASCALAVIAIKEYMINNRLEGTIKLFGCPGEEGGSGKTFMAREGIFDDLDAAITWHPKNQNSVTNSSSLANIQSKFKFKGKSAHAGGAPHLGRSALDAVELMHVGVNYLREHVIQDARLHYAITNTGGVSPNVVQADAETVHYVRAPEMSAVNSIYERVCNIARGAALMTDTSVEIEIIKATSNTIINSTLNRVMDQVYSELGEISYNADDYEYANKYMETLSEEDIKHVINVVKRNMTTENFMQNKETLMNSSLLPFHVTLKEREVVRKGSTDVADVSWIVPTVQAGVVCYAKGTPGHSWQKVAQGKSSIAKKGLIYSSKVMALTALKLLDNPLILEAAKRELQNRVGPTGYICPIPENVFPSKI